MIMPLLSRVRTFIRGESSVADERSSSQPLHCLPETPRLKVGNSHTPALSGASPSRCYAQMAQDLRSSMPSTYRWLDPEDIKLVGKHPIGAGGFANIWEVIHNGRKAVLKSYRYYVSYDVAQVVTVRSGYPCVGWYAANITQRFRNEIHVHSLLHRGDVNVVPLVGIYSTESHPFGLIYEYMEGLDLKQYLRNQPSVGRLELVIAPRCSPSDASRGQLVGVARCLERVHNLDVVHEDLQTVCPPSILYSHVT